MKDFYPADGLRRFQMWSDIRVRAGWRLQSQARTRTLRVVDHAGSVRLTGDADPCCALFTAMAPAWTGAHVVVLLHSLAGSPALLRPLEARLTVAGCQTANIAYPNLYVGMADHVRQMTGLIDAMAADGIRRVSFVGHSYGGLLIRALWKADLPVERGPVAFFGTPNGGSGLAAMMHHVPGFRLYFGAASQDVLAAAVTRLPVPETPILVVAGGLGRRGFNPLLRGNNDGIVTVEETKLPGVAHDFVYVPGCHHRYLPRSRKGIEAALAHLAR